MSEKYNKRIKVTSPLLPPLEEYIPFLQKIWDSEILTNNGDFHKELENRLCTFLRVPYLNLFTNGTLPLMCALQALRITGEVITTPFSFVATTHSLWWNGISPVFVDIESERLTLDPAKIEAAITPKTTAIMPVHVYGNPCYIKEIQEIADKYGLRVIYDAAHAFAVEENGESILKAGDLSSLSFHATKVFNTVEGGALISNDIKIKERVDFLKNFGFANETTVVAPGINGKMDEVRAAFGILSMKYVTEAIAKRKHVAETYRKELESVTGISFLNDIPGVRHNYAYFPIFVDGKAYGEERDSLYNRMKTDYNIYGRRYFYPLISEFSTYRGLDSSSVKNLPVAYDIADKVICLPIHHAMSDDDISRVIEAIKNGK